jgi:hypothetical protein
VGADLTKRNHRTRWSRGKELAPRLVTGVPGDSLWKWLPLGPTGDRRTATLSTRHHMCRCLRRTQDVVVR